MKEISIRSFEGVGIGQTENAKAGTGCTVFVLGDGMPAGLDVRGGGPASREPLLLDPLTAAQKINAICIAGGSAFGLGASDGVMKCLEERGIGYDVAVTKIPLVCQSDIFDLTVADAFTRPNYRDGNFGAGCGATVGKIAGMQYCMKSGIGSFAADYDGLMVGAVVVVNALGDVFDSDTGKQIAGLRSEDGSLRSTLEYMEKNSSLPGDKFTGNTTIAVVLTNAAFSKPQLCKIAGMAHDGMARSIRPVHTSADGDSIYAVSAGNVEADMDLVGALAAEAVSKAITRAVKSAAGAYGYPSAADQEASH